MISTSVDLLTTLDPPVESSDELSTLRSRVLSSLSEQGFRVSGGRLIAPVPSDKHALRSLHLQAVDAQRDRARPALEKLESKFLSHMIQGKKLDVESISPSLILIPTGDRELARLWRWASIHWSIPVSGGYGRRLRYLVVDKGNDDALVGIIGLADPVFSLSARDREIGWSAEDRRTALANVMDAFVLGAVPPYSQLLGGKLIASLLQSDQLRHDFASRYGHKRTLIADRDPDAQLALVTTSSALGRSSVYNRVQRSDGSLSMRSVGYTRGSGDFQFSGELYDELVKLAARHTESGVTDRNAAWGTGFRNRREVVHRALPHLGLNARSLRVHGVQREVFITVLASNSLSWLRRRDCELEWITQPTTEIGSWWLARWAVPRSHSTTTWRDFNPSTWRLWN